MLRKTSRLNPHVCFATFRNPNDEHISLLTSEAKIAGYDVCWLKFPAMPYDVGKSIHHQAINYTKISSIGKFHRHMKRSNSQLVTLQSPYPGNFPDWLPTALERVPTAYFGYGLTLSMNEQAHFRAPLLDNCDFVGASCLYEFQGHSFTHPTANVVLTGSTFIYRLRMLIENAVPNTEHSNLLWAPHWSRSWMPHVEGYSRWAETIETLYHWVRKNPDVQLKVRAHPYLQDALVGFHKGFSESKNPNVRQSIDPKVDQDALILMSNLLSLSNVVLSNDSMLNDIMDSDALITDGISILGYWAVTGKPMIFIRDSGSPTMNEVGEKIVSQCDLSPEPSDLQIWLNDWKIGRKGHRAEPKRTADSLFPTFSKSPFELLIETVNGQPAFVKESK